MRNLTRSLLLGTASLAMSVAAVDGVMLDDAEAGSLTCGASTCSASTTFGPHLTDISDTLDLPYFNSGIGTLRSVSIKLTGTVYASGTAHLTSFTTLATATAKVSVSSNLTFGSLPDFGTTSFLVIPTQAVLTFTSPSAQHYTNAVTTNTATLTTSGAAISDFIGGVGNSFGFSVTSRLSTTIL